MTHPIEVKKIGNQISHRMPNWPSGVWSAPQAPLDAILDHIAREFEMQPNLRSRSYIYGQIGMCNATACRLRSAGTPSSKFEPFVIPSNWILLLHDFSGIPVKELRWVGGLSAEFNPHPKARKA